MIGSLLFKSVRDLSLIQAALSHSHSGVPGRGHRLGRGRGLGGRPWPSFGGTRLSERPTTCIISSRQAETASLFSWFVESEILESLNCVGYSLAEPTRLDPSAAGVSTNNLYNVYVYARKKRPARSQQRMNIDISSMSLFSLSPVLSPPRRSRPHRCRRRRSSRLVACFDASVVGALCGSSRLPNRPCCSMCSCP